MRKTNTNVLGEMPPKKRSKVVVAIQFMILFALTPFVYEGTLICVAQWRSMYGRTEIARTPFIDYVTSTLESMQGDAGRMVTPIFRGLPWKPAIVIPVTIAWTGLAVMMLRR